MENDDMTALTAARPSIPPWRPFALAAALLARGRRARHAQTADAAFRATTLNLSASGESKVTPDLATITLGVQTDGRPPPRP
jgi:uncharacterized protein YggE